MFRTGTTSVRMLQAVSLVASLAILMWSLGLPSINFAGAANLTSISNTLSDSDLGAVSNHLITFTTPTTSVGIASGESLVITFPNGFNISTSSVDDTDIDLTIDGAEQTLVSGAPGAAEWQVTISGQDVTFLSGGAGATSTPGDVLVVEIGLNADSGDQQVTNHSAAGSYEFNIVAGPDSGSTRVVIIDDVDVSASVDTVFNFTIGGFSGTGINVNGTSTTATSSATTINFGQLTADVVATAAQLLNVTTNASNGFVVTVQQSQNLRSATGADIDGYVNGSYIDTPTNWFAPSSTVGTESTYGHWGLTSSDDLNAGEFQACTGSATGCWVAASTTARQVFENNGPADGSSTNIGSTTVGYQVEITSLQEAADDYSTTLTYIATPTF